MKITLVFIFTFILSGCGMKKLAVENADNLLYYQITRRIPLYSEQKDQLKKDLNAFLNKSKPKAQDILPVIDQIDINQNSKFESQYEKLEGFYLNIAGDFSDLISMHLSQLDHKQQKDFFDTLDDENSNIRKREKKQTIKKIEERIETILGSISGKQKVIIREFENYFYVRNKMRFERRTKLQEEFREIYKQDISPSSRITSFQEAFKKYQASALRENKNLEILRKFIPTISTDQKEHLRRHIQEVKDLLRYYLSVDY
jgi:hypothetical protein